jgi:hypothetical protein
MTRYNDFVKEHMASRGEGVHPKEHMKVIAKKWNEIKGEGIIPSKDKIYLLLSKEAYVEKAKRQNTITANQEEFKYDKALSTPRVAIYHSPTRLIIAHRGTLGNSADLYADTYILNGTFDKSDRAKSALHIALKAIRKYPNLKVSNTGHSLGGACAQFVGMNLPLEDSKVVAFNAGSSPFNMSNWWRWSKCKMGSKSAECKKRKNQTLYTTPTDPIGFWDYGKTFVSTEKNAPHPHSMDNYVAEGPDQVLTPTIRGAGIGDVFSVAQKWFQNKKPKELSWGDVLSITIVCYQVAKSKTLEEFKTNVEKANREVIIKTTKKVVTSMLPEMGFVMSTIIGSLLDTVISFAVNQYYDETEAVNKKSNWWLADDWYRRLEYELNQIVENWNILKNKYKESVGSGITSDFMTMDVPLFIRLLEWSRETAKSDEELHKVAEKAMAHHGPLTMKQYSKLV